VRPSLTRPDPDRGGRGDTIVYGVVLPVGLYLFTMLGFVPNTSFRPAGFFAQYSHGIYRYRFLAREVIAGTASVIGHLAGRSLSPSGALFSAFVVVGCTSLAGLGLLLYRTTVGRNQEALTAYLVLIVVLVVSTYSVTPYDLPSYLLIAVTCVAAVGPRPRPAIVCAGAAAVATCTRESAFLAAAAAVALCWALDRPRSWSALLARVRGVGPEATRWRNAAAVSAATAVTYAVIHLVLAAGGSRALWSGPGVAANLGDRHDRAGVVMAVVAGAVVWRSYARLGGRLDRPARARRALWALALPYLAVSALGGIWFEAPRLVAPVLLCEYLVVVFCLGACPSGVPGPAPAPPEAAAVRP
jgi:hypothetical protein